MNINYFKDVTLLITHYNRSKSLENLLKICKQYNLEFEATIVSDDASQIEHLEKVQELQKNYNFELVTTPINKGLGNNINKGQQLVRTPYTLYIQEDFEPTAHFAQNFRNAVKLMDEENQWDIIRFYTFPWDPFPYLKNYKYGYSQMLYKPSLWYINHLKFRLYSDHPHLRRNNFSEKFGFYNERKRGDPTEYNMCLSFIKNKGKALLFTEKELFIHENGSIEPNTIVRSKWKLSSSYFVKIARSIFLKFKVIHSTLRLLLIK